jgi:hypothetical protein
MARPATATTRPTRETCSRRILTYHADVSVGRCELDYELKCNYQRFLHGRNRGNKDCDGRPDREPEEIARWAREHDLPYDDGHVHCPDARIEYEDRDGLSRHEDLEIVTGHYRGAHAGAVARSGFSCYRARRASTENGDGDSNGNDNGEALEEGGIDAVVEVSDDSRHSHSLRLSGSPPSGKLLIPLERRDVRVVEGARLEIDSGRVC